MSSFADDVEARLLRLDGVSTIHIGSAGQGSPVYPLLACLAPGAGPPDRPWLLVSAGVHGDEVAGVFAALAFLEKQATALAPPFQVALLPCINPSGFARGTLETADGANLNRLFGTESRQPEVAAIESWLKRSGRWFAATFDLHEVPPDYQGEGFVASDNPRACYLYETQADRTRRIGRALIDALPASFEICRWPFIYKDRNDDGVVSYPEACHNPVYAQQTTFDAYLHSRFTHHSFTLETPLGWLLEKRVEAQLAWLERAMSLLGAAHVGRDGRETTVGG